MLPLVVASDPCILHAKHFYFKSRKLIHWLDWISDGVSAASCPATLMKSTRVREFSFPRRRRRL
jgi:hypothetical protein